jgi:serine/threonine-protein kinase
MALPAVVEKPEMLGRYQLVRQLGRGGMAEVFAAKLQSLGGFERDVAVKVLRPELASEPEFIDMLLDEARIAGAIRHPAVVQMLDVGREDDRFYLVMELVDGTDLRSLVRRLPEHRLPVEAALFVVGELLRGLGAVHASPSKVIHRDVSPANVLIDSDGAVKLGDFGIARAAVRLSRTRKGTVKGKLRYMAPEQTTGRPVDHRADLYAAGVVLCELLLGPAECAPQRVTELGPTFSWARVRLRRPDLMPADVSAILDRALADDPDARFPDAATFGREIAAALDARAIGYSSTQLAAELAQMVSDGTRQSREGLSDGPTERQSITTPGKTPTRRPPLALVEDKITDERATRPRRLPLIVAGIVVGLLLACALPLALIGSRPHPALPPPVVVSAPAPLPPPAPTTGTLIVSGPRGAIPMIGAVRYPAAPTRIELPPGRYDIRIRRQHHSITVAAGESAVLR